MADVRALRLLDRLAPDVLGESGARHGSSESKTLGGTLANRMERPEASTRLRLGAAAVAVAALAFAFAYPMQVNGYNQNAHYAFVRALADGKPYVDKALGEIGEVSHPRHLGVRGPHVRDEGAGNGAGVATVLRRGEATGCARPAIRRA